MKSCSKCKEVKEFISFHKSSRNKCGYRSQCISCENEYKEINKDKRKEYDRVRSFNNKDIKRLNSLTYYSLNKDNILLNRKEHYKNNKESKLEYQREYQKNNREKRNSYLVERRQNDPLFKLITNIRNLIYNSFYYNGYSKNSKTEELLGCSFIDLKEYLESKFEPWMTWENRGLYNGELNYGWDIDHIVPLSSVNSEEDIIKLNNYTNLQPLCSKINRDIKKDNLEYGQLQ